MVKVIFELLAYAVIILGFLVGLVGGWILNLYQLYHMNFDVITGQIVLKVVGIFVPPIGAVLGWIG